MICFVLLLECLTSFLELVVAGIAGSPHMISATVISVARVVYEFRSKCCDTVEPLLWETSIKWTPLFRGHNIWSRKKVHITFVSVTSIEGIPLFRGNGHLFWVPEYTLALKTWLATKRVDTFKCTLITLMTAITNWTISFQSMHCTCENSTPNIVEITL